MSCCKTLDTTNENKRKTASVILTRGRTILKKRYDAKKHVLRNSLSKVTMSGWDAHKAKTLGQNGSDLPADSAIAAAADDSPTTLKKAIKLEDKLISGEEIEFYPDFRVNSRHTSEKTAAHLANENPRQSESEFFKFYSTLNNGTPDETDRSTDKSPIIAEDYPKLYVTVTKTSEKDATARSSLLKSIRGIQRADEDSYGINISNSRFFVPKDYIFSGVESAMNDLKFEVDPEMGKLLQRSYSTPRMGARSSLVAVNIETDPSSSAHATTETTPTKQREGSRHVKTLSDTSVILRSKESDQIERSRQRLFLKKRDSKPSCEVIDFLLDEKSNASTAIQSENGVEPLDSKSDGRSREAKTESPKNSPTLKSVSLKDEAATRKIPSNTQLWTAKHVIIDDDEITIKPASDANDRTFDEGKDSKIPDSSDKHIEVNKESLRLTENTSKRTGPCDTPNVILARRKSYPLLAEVSSRSECPSLVTPPRTPTRVLNKLDGLETGANKDGAQNGETIPSEGESRATNAISSRGITDPICKDQPAPMGRTSSLREKFETIVEDVEFRSAPGRRSQISDRKSLS